MLSLTQELKIGVSVLCAVLSDRDSPNRLLGPFGRQMLLPPVLAVCQDERSDLLSVPKGLVTAGGYDVFEYS